MEHQDRTVGLPGVAGGGSWERTVAPASGLSGLDAVRVGGKVVVVGGADYDQTEVKAAMPPSGPEPSC
jgi:hypothetical protein